MIPAYSSLIFLNLRLAALSLFAWCKSALPANHNSPKEIMKSQIAGSFITRMHQKFFDWSINREIFMRIFPHLQNESVQGYPFDSHAEIEEQTDELNAQRLLDEIEDHVRNMPKGYARAFRYILHRDLHERLCRYEKVARRRIQPKTCDPRYIATHASP